MKYPASRVLLALMAFAMLPSGGAAQVPSPPMEYGGTIFPMGYPETTQRDLGLAVNARLGWARVTIPWRSVEASCKGCYDWTDLDRVVAATNAAGVKFLGRIDQQPAWSRQTPAESGPPDAITDYVDFVRAVAERYRAGSPLGTIDAIQVWNEPNLSREWGNAVIDREQASQYMYMLKESYKAIKAVDPSKIVLNAGLSPTGTSDGTAQPDDVYLGWLYDSGLARYSDAIGLHGPGYGSAPEAEPLSNPAFPHASFYFRRIEQLRAIMEANGDGAKQVWLLEFGWTTDQVNPDRAFYAVTPEQQADYLVRGLQYARANWTPWIGVMFVWSLTIDPNWTPASEQYWWSVTNADGSPRPAYEALVRARALGMLP
ncbi:MAG: cellulase family glycosylhydrolase [Chloroflexota bacterium]|nr:cellulase family glycosylhydrolase [Chloroflexota bacterium]